MKAKCPKCGYEFEVGVKGTLTPEHFKKISEEPTSKFTRIMEEYGVYDEIEKEKEVDKK